MTKTVALAALMMIAGCAGPRPVDRVSYSADSGVSTEMLAAACQVWSVVGVECGPAETAGNVHVYARDMEVAAGTTDDWTDPVRVWIDMRRADRIIIAHEFGHALGLGHFDNGLAVMNTVYGYQVTGLTEIDISGYHASRR